ncbi:Transcriptional regulator CRZ1 [Mycena venus]|uniref:Transcriptional regulator CRZ1 n=1 Tax=Mycena venus TaxID=2733690 RepID=A0A8H7CZV8_9AGAR|nr:Transcriptional regulator CRZ1 [Mycena venus]
MWHPMAYEHNILGPYANAACIWDVVSQSDGIGSQTHIPPNRPSMIVSTLAPGYSATSNLQEAPRRNEYHETTRNFHSYVGDSGLSQNIRENHNSSDSSFGVLLVGTERDRRMSDSQCTTQQHTNDFEPRDGTLSWNGVALQSSGSQIQSNRSTFSISNHATIERNLLSPYLDMNGNRRSQSADNRENFMQLGRLLLLEELTPSISGYPRYEESACNDGWGSGSLSWSDVTSEWASPKPSPNPSPQSISSHLPDIDGRTEIPIVVLKQDVTSERMRKASERRRQQKGDVRMPCHRVRVHIHTARQFAGTYPRAYRRETVRMQLGQLHAVGHPFACVGCKKNFARLDALNRHLRSKGGEECRQMTARYGKTGDTEMTQSEPPLSSAGTAVWPDSRKTFPSVAL